MKFNEILYIFNVIFISIYFCIGFYIIGILYNKNHIYTLSIVLFESILCPAYLFLMYHNNKKIENIKFEKIK